MKLAVLAAAIALTTLASAQQYGGSSSGSSGAGGGASGGGGGGESSEMMIPPFLIPFLHKVNRATIAHGTLMCLAFVIFMPAGAFVIRLGHFRGTVYVHAGLQMFAYALALAGLGLGVFVAHAPTKIGGPSLIGQYHPIIGLTILAALVFQPVLGALHHAVYVREQRRSIWSTLHVWWGRLFMTFAIIQGGLGLRFAGNTHGGEIAYGVVAGLIWVAWMGVAVWHDMNKNKGPELKEKRSGSEETGQGRAAST